MLLIGQPTPVVCVGEVIGETGLSETVRVGRGVGRVAVSLVSPFAERVEQGPLCAVCRGVYVRKTKSGEC